MNDGLYFNAKLSSKVSIRAPEVCFQSLLELIEKSLKLYLDLTGD
jgi:hypothetical protein